MMPPSITTPQQQQHPYMSNISAMPTMPHMPNMPMQYFDPASAIMYNPAVHGANASPIPTAHLASLMHMAPMPAPMMQDDDNNNMNTMAYEDKDPYSHLPDQSMPPPPPPSSGKRNAQQQQKQQQQEARYASSASPLNGQHPSYAFDTQRTQHAQQLTPQLQQRIRGQQTQQRQQQQQQLQREEEAMMNAASIIMKNSQGGTNSNNPSPNLDAFYKANMGNNSNPHSPLLQQQTSPPSNAYTPNQNMNVSMNRGIMYEHEDDKHRMIINEMRQVLDQGNYDLHAHSLDQVIGGVGNNASLLMNLSSMPPPNHANPYMEQPGSSSHPAMMSLTRQRSAPNVQHLNQQGYQEPQHRQNPTHNAVEKIIEKKHLHDHEQLHKGDGLKHSRSHPHLHTECPHDPINRQIHPELHQPHHPFGVIELANLVVPNNNAPPAPAFIWGPCHDIMMHPLQHAHRFTPSVHLHSKWTNLMKLEVDMAKTPPWNDEKQEFRWHKTWRLPDIVVKCSSKVPGLPLPIGCEVGLCVVVAKENTPMPSEVDIVDVFRDDNVKPSASHDGIGLSYSPILDGEARFSRLRITTTSNAGINNAGGPASAAARQFHLLLVFLMPVKSLEQYNAGTPIPGDGSENMDADTFRQAFTSIGHKTANGTNYVVASLLSPGIKIYSRAESESRTRPHVMGREPATSPTTAGHSVSRRKSGSSKETMIAGRFFSFDPLWFTKELANKTVVVEQGNQQTVKFLIENDWSGLRNYLKALNIRHKVRHPILLGVRFSSVLAFMYDSKKLTQETLTNSDASPTSSPTANYQENLIHSLFCATGFPRRCTISNCEGCKVRDDALMNRENHVGVIGPIGKRNNDFDAKNSGKAASLKMENYVQVVGGPKKLGTDDDSDDPESQANYNNPSMVADTLWYLAIRSDADMPDDQRQWLKEHLEYINSAVIGCADGRNLPDYYLPLPDMAEVRRLYIRMYQLQNATKHVLSDGNVYPAPAPITSSAAALSKLLNSGDMSKHQKFNASGSWKPGSSRADTKSASIHASKFIAGQRNWSFESANSDLAGALLTDDSAKARFVNFVQTVHDTLRSDMESLLLFATKLVESLDADLLETLSSLYSKFSQSLTRHCHLEDFFLYSKLDSKGLGGVTESYRFDHLKMSKSLKNIQTEIQKVNQDNVTDLFVGISKFIAVQREHMLKEEEHLLPYFLTLFSDTEIETLQNEVETLSTKLGV